MRLLHTTELTLSSFYDECIPPYAILSHTWGDDEVSFEDLLQKASSELEKWEGYSKIRSCCTLAASAGYDFVWIDTCCIDKTSSAELSEAINSMYRWYQDAGVCYAYLDDVLTFNKDSLTSDGGRDFRESRWFTRGWTLQELLAPKFVEFYRSDWQYCGSKSALGAQISLITGIQEDHIFDINEASAAQKMSWASGRMTTRVEDIAYSLMGIFDVNMPLLYGEGKKAFIRLQHEIVKVSDDESLFAWTDDSLVESGIFAQSPKVFAGSGNVVRNTEGHRLYVRRAPYAVTNWGFAIEVFAHSKYSATIMTDWGTSFVPLNCGRESKPGFASDQQLAVELENISPDIFVRSSPGLLCPPMWSVNALSPKLVYVRPIYLSYDAHDELNSFFISASSLWSCKLWIADHYNCHPEIVWEEDQRYYKVTPGGRCAALMLNDRALVTFGLVFREAIEIPSIDIFVHSKDQTFQSSMHEYKYGHTSFLPSQEKDIVTTRLQDNRWVTGTLRRKTVGPGERQFFVDIDMDKPTLEGALGEQRSYSLSF